jgi:heme/copper-type cytochrome/quinol oxidase subunit 4
MILGVLAIILGTLPVWMIDRQVSVGPLGSRFGLAAIFGVVIFWVGFLEWLSPKSKVKVTIIGVLIAVAIHANLHIAKAYQQSWEKQRTFYCYIGGRLISNQGLPLSRTVKYSHTLGSIPPRWGLACYIRL